VSVQRLYDRYAKLIVFNTQEGTPGTNGKPLNQIDQTGSQFASKSASGIPQYRFKFRIEKLAGPVPSPNPSVIQIWNLGPESRNLVSKLYNLVILQAGYGNNIKTIFKGTITKTITRKNGPDYVTEITAGDGIYATQNSVINTSFSTPTSSSQILTTLVSAMGGQGVSPGLMTAQPTKVYQNGIVLSGKVVDLLKQICDDNNINFTIEDQKVVMVPYGGALSADTILISENTGMIGIPEIREQNASGLPALISFKSLLNPDLGSFKPVFVVSKFVNGIYTAAKVTHEGDTWGNEWFTEVEAT
jgi:hypothetical protein